MDAYFIYLANKVESIRIGSPPDGVGILRELRTLDLWRGALAEFMATLLFVFIGTMSAVAVGSQHDDSSDLNEIEKAGQYVKIALTFGFMITVCIQMVGHVSGGHMNPAVSLAMAVTLNISSIRALLYVIAQCAGAIAGSFILKGVTPPYLHGNLGVTSVNGDMSVAQGFVCEALFTFILVMSIFGCTDRHRPMFGSPAVGVGITIAAVHLAAIPFTGASMNPARSLGSAVASNSFDGHWVYWLGPVVGGVLAGLAYKHVLCPYRHNLSYEDTIKELGFHQNFLKHKDVITEVDINRHFLKHEDIITEQGVCQHFLKHEDVITEVGMLRHYLKLKDVITELGIDRHNLKH
ncbi:aquaporin AQPAe.a-like [Mya arenaria]|uniref:aquaporin AQPAe.a-like n=1 Tax=Mya arenaria TaxID=6604 RepID=UPI0022E87743|nr:aquaporin AQPAe.a-like [Mya arenaria]